MAGLSTYLQSAVAAWLRGTAMPSAPGGLYVALFTADPTDAGTLTAEATTTIRAAGRPAVTLGAPATAGGTTTATNSAAVNFGNAAGAANCTHFGIFDAATGGSMLGSNPLTGGNISAGQAVSFAVGALSVALS